MRHAAALTLSLVRNHGHLDARTGMTTNVIVYIAWVILPILSAGINSAVSAVCTKTRFSLPEISRHILAICTLMLKSSCMHQYLMSNKDVSTPQYFGARAIGIMSTVFTQPHP